MENEDTTVENNDCDIVDIGGVEQPLSDGNRYWKLCNSVSLPSAEVVFFTKSVSLHFVIFFHFKIVFLQPKL